MKKIDIVKLRIIKCSASDRSFKCWYKNRVGEELYFFDKPFKDDRDVMGLWRAKIPTKKYVYIEDTNYDMIIRKKKLEQIENINNR